MALNVCCVDNQALTMELYWVQYLAGSYAGAGEPCLIASRSLLSHFYSPATNAPHIRAPGSCPINRTEWYSTDQQLVPDPRVGDTFLLITIQLYLIFT